MTGNMGLDKRSGLITRHRHEGEVFAMGHFVPLHQQLLACAHQTLQMVAMQLFSHSPQSGRPLFDHGPIELRHFCSRCARARAVGKNMQMRNADLFRQPRLATFNRPLSRWVHALELSFEKTLASYVADAFPTFSHSTQVQIANVLFNLGNPSGLTVWGIAAIQRTLQSWRSLSAPTIPVLGDPLSLLPVTHTNAAGVWHLENVPNLYHGLSFRTDGVQALLHGAMASPTENGLRALMVERLVGSRYEMVAGFNQPSELMFRRAGSDQLFWMSLRRAWGERVEGPSGVAPRNTNSPGTFSAYSEKSSLGDNDAGRRATLPGAANSSAGTIASVNPPPKALDAPGKPATCAASAP